MGRIEKIIAVIATTAKIARVGQHRFSILAILVIMAIMAIITKHCRRVDDRAFLGSMFQKTEGNALVATSRTASNIHARAGQVGEIVSSGMVTEK